MTTPRERFQRDAAHTVKALLDDPDPLDPFEQLVTDALATSEPEAQAFVRADAYHRALAERVGLTPAQVALPADVLHAVTVRRAELLGWLRQAVELGRLRQVAAPEALDGGRDNWRRVLSDFVAKGHLAPVTDAEFNLLFPSADSVSRALRAPDRTCVACATWGDDLARLQLTPWPPDLDVSGEALCTLEGRLKFDDLVQERLVELRAMERAVAEALTSACVRCRARRIPLEAYLSALHATWKTMQTAMLEIDFTVDDLQVDRRARAASVRDAYQKICDEFAAATRPAGAAVSTGAVAAVAPMDALGTDRWGASVQVGVRTTDTGPYLVLDARLPNGARVAPELDAGLVRALGRVVAAFPDAPARSVDGGGSVETFRDLCQNVAQRPAAFGATASHAERVLFGAWYMVAGPHRAWTDPLAAIGLWQGHPSRVEDFGPHRAWTDPLAAIGLWQGHPSRVEDFQDVTRLARYLAAHAAAWPLDPSGGDLDERAARLPPKKGAP